MCYAYVFHTLHISRQMAQQCSATPRNWARLHSLFLSIPHFCIAVSSFDEQYHIFPYLNLYSVHNSVTRRDSAVGIATGCRVGRPRGRSSSPGGGKIFHFSMSSRPDSRAQPASHPKVPGIKRPAREADQSPPTISQVKKTWSYTSTFRRNISFLYSGSNKPRKIKA
jgi:hypothetical protein